MQEQEKIVSFLKRKGTGQKMGSPLSDSDLYELTTLFSSQSVSLITKATLLTAILALPPSDNELAWIKTVLTPQYMRILPKELHPFITHTGSTFYDFISIILDLITGQSLNDPHESRVFSHLFREDIPDYLKAAFLEALRLKDETFIENLACLEALGETVSPRYVETSLLIDLSLPYDGFNRTPSLVLFAAPLLASLGFPTYLHGVRSIGPKYGITPAQLLLEANKNPFISHDDHCTNLEQSSIGWSYIDQSVFSPPIFRLQTLRNLMVKRPLLATLEKLVQPTRHSSRSYLICSYTHPPYKQKLLDLISAQHDTIHSAILFRGQEGSIQLPLDKRAKVSTVMDGSHTTDFCRATDILQTSPHPLSDYTHSVSESLSLGLSALQGHEGYARDMLLYFCTSILSILNLMPRKDAYKALSDALSSGKALQHWEKGCL